jgi:integrase/recombinase XerD
VTVHAAVPLPDPGILGGHIKSFNLELRYKQRVESTRNGYCGAATRLAGWLLNPTIPADLVIQPKELKGVPFSGDAVKPVNDWRKVKTGHIKLYVIYLAEVMRYGDGYVNNQFRALQQFWKWLAAEESVANPMVGLSPPRIGEKLVPLIAIESMRALIKDTEPGKNFESRRDLALLRVFASTGGRLTELARLDIKDVDLDNRQAKVLGKGNRERMVKYDVKAARALDRYIRLRARHPAVVHDGCTALWIGVRRRRGMTSNGVRRIITRRAKRLGLKIWPHMFRHTFVHNWLDGGGAEGDLQELAGWGSPAMLARYGRSARAARAARAFDRVDVMRGA